MRKIAISVWGLTSGVLSALVVFILSILFQTYFLNSPPLCGYYVEQLWGRLVFAGVPLTIGGILPFFFLKNKKIIYSWAYLVGALIFSGYVFYSFSNILCLGGYASQLFK